MIKYKKVIKHEFAIDNVTCNRCGKTLEEHGEYIHVAKAWGFNSNKDFETHSFDICEKCYDEITSSFKIKPDVQDT